jgi:hypothetical protein
MPFLQRRDRTWYFRYRIPGPLRSLARRSELRISLGTHELVVARERVERVLPDVYRLKQLARHMTVLEASHVQRALDIAFSEIVEKLERSRARRTPYDKRRREAPTARKDNLCR